MCAGAPAAPAVAFVELGDEPEEAERGGVDVRGEFGDLAGEFVELSVAFGDGSGDAHGDLRCGKRRLSFVSRGLATSWRGACATIGACGGEHGVEDGDRRVGRRVGASSGVMGCRQCREFSRRRETSQEKSDIGVKETARWRRGQRELTVEPGKRRGGEAASAGLVDLVVRDVARSPHAIGQCLVASYSRGGEP